MNKDELKNIAESLIETFNYAGKESVRLYSEGLKIEIKEDKSPVSNGDLRVNDLIQKKISELTPNIKIVSEETGFPSLRKAPQYRSISPSKPKMYPGVRRCGFLRQAHSRS